MESQQWPALATSHPLVHFLRELPGVLSTAGHIEVWGVTLTLAAPELTTATEGVEKVNPHHLPPIPVMNVLQKYLRANKNDVSKAVAQLQETLVWRKKFNPRAAAFQEKFDEETFGRLGYITEVKDQMNKDTVVVWNIYGAVKDNKKTFGDVDQFLRWRIGLMERSLAPLDLAHASTPIPDFSATTSTIDPYQCIQVHDYLNVSFLRQDPAVKAASKATIALMSAHYPELLSRKFFINVPVVMGWMFAAMKLLLPKETVAKFVVLSYGE